MPAGIRYRVLGVHHERRTARQAGTAWRFLALVGGATIAGPVAHQASAAGPTLILPPALVPAPETALVTLGKADFDAVLRIKAMIPPAYYRNWLDGGLRNADMFQGRDEGTMESILRERYRRQAEEQARMPPRTVEQERERLKRIVDEVVARNGWGRT